MKTLITFLALSFVGTSAIAQGLSMTSLTPSITFPETKTDDQTVTKGTTTLNK